MVELFKLAIAKPMNAVIVALCIAVTTLSAGAANTKVALAVLEEKQEVNEKYQDKIVTMSETLIRVDQNLTDVKTHFKIENP